MRLFLNETFQKVSFNSDHLMRLLLNETFQKVSFSSSCLMRLFLNETLQKVLFNSDHLMRLFLSESFWNVSFNSDHLMSLFLNETFQKISGYFLGYHWHISSNGCLFFLAITDWFVISNHVCFWQPFFYFFTGLTFLLQIINLLLVNINVIFRNDWLFCSELSLICLFVALIFNND